MNSRSEWGGNTIPRVTPAPVDPEDNPNPGETSEAREITPNANPGIHTPEAFPRRKRRRRDVQPPNPNPKYGPMYTFLRRAPTLPLAGLARVGEVENIESEIAETGADETGMPGTGTRNGLISTTR